MHRTEQNRTTAAEERRGDALLREVFRAHHNFHLLFFLSEASVAEGGVTHTACSAAAAAAELESRIHVAHEQKSAPRRGDYPMFMYNMRGYKHGCMSSNALCVMHCV